MIKAIIIDDEEAAIRVLTNLLQHFATDIEIVATARNVPEGVLAINRNKPDVVFLDIEMPDYSGFELLEFFNEVEFEIIFTTAYSQYAIQAFEVSAVDYVLKPIQIDKLEASIEKLKAKLNSHTMYERLQALKTNLKDDVIKKIALPVSDGLLFINVEDIIHLDADGAYTKVWVKGGTSILVSKNLKYFEDLLEKHTPFFRPHRSNIINVNFLKKYSRHDELLIMDNNHEISLSKNRKQDFEDFMKQFH